MGERKYIAVSIKHTEYGWKFGMPCVLWGYKQTKDDEKRCFADYTRYLSNAERYAIGEFEEHGYGHSTVKPEPVKMEIGFCKKWRKFDTVLVDAEEYELYCKMCNIKMEP